MTLGHLDSYASLDWRASSQSEIRYSSTKYAMVNDAMSLSDPLNRMLHRGTVLLYNNSFVWGRGGSFCARILLCNQEPRGYVPALARDRERHFRDRSRYRVEAQAESCSSQPGPAWLTPMANKSTDKCGRRIRCGRECGGARRAMDAALGCIGRLRNHTFPCPAVRGCTCLDLTDQEEAWTKLPSTEQPVFLDPAVSLPGDLGDKTRYTT